MTTMGQSRVSLISRTMEKGCASRIANHWLPFIGEVTAGLVHTRIPTLFYHELFYRPCNAVLIRCGRHCAVQGKS